MSKHQQIELISMYLAKHMIKSLPFFLVILFLAISCAEKKEQDESNFWENPSPIDLSDIKKRGTLRVVVDNSSTSYYIYRGRRMGYEYELLRDLCEDLGVLLMPVVTDNIEGAFKLLNEGKADIIAMNLEVSEERKQYADFTDPTNQVSTVLVQRTDGHQLEDLS